MTELVSALTFPQLSLFQTGSVQKSPIMATSAFRFTKIRLKATTGQELSSLSYKTARVAPGADTVAKAVLMGQHLVWSWAQASLAFSGNARASGLKVKVVSLCEERRPVSL